MTRCSSENNFPVQGLAWTPPDPLRCELESDRLVIRGYRLGDAELLFDAIETSRDGHLLPWMPWARNQHRTLESSIKYVCEQILSLASPDTFNNVGTGIFCKSTGRLLGGTGVHDVRRDTASCETGYWIRRDAIGHGYALEACARTISWALESQAKTGLGLNRVRIYCSSANTHSAKLIEKLNLTPEVRQRSDFYIETIGLTDRLGWGVLADEWDCDTHRVKPSASA